MYLVGEHNSLQKIFFSQTQPTHQSISFTKSILKLKDKQHQSQKACYQNTNSLAPTSSLRGLNQLTLIPTHIRHIKEIT